MFSFLALHGLWEIVHVVHKTSERATVRGLADLVVVALADCLIFLSLFLSVFRWRFEAVVSVSSVE